MSTRGDAFASTILRAYDNAGEVALSKTMYGSAQVREAAHPLFSDLEIGHHRTADVASLFLDLSHFTWRSFWDDPLDVANLADAVLTGFTQVVHDLGGHVVGLRGDGLYAVFGPAQNPVFAVATAGMAAAAALNYTAEYLNPQLAARGIKTVIARAGIDFGTVTFTRSGISSANEINVVGFTANFAAKCEKVADAWQVVVGQGFFEQTVGGALTTSHAQSPKSFTLDGDKKHYYFYDYSWRKALTQVDGAIEELAGTPLESTKY